MKLDWEEHQLKNMRPMILAPEPIVFEQEARPNSDNAEPADIAKLIAFDVITYMPVLRELRSRELNFTPLSGADTDLGLRAEISDLIRENVDLTLYSGHNRPKVTKGILSQLLKLFPTLKKEGGFDTCWARACDAVQKRYLSGGKYLVYFGEKNLLGEGVYEGIDTCFGIGGENEHHKLWLMANRRAQTLVMVKLIGDDPGPYDDVIDCVRHGGWHGGTGRCLVWFDGSRNVYFMNPYSYGMNVDLETFMEAFKALMKMPEATTDDRPERRLDLEIYLNNIPVHMYDKRSNPDLPGRRIRRCVCGRLEHSGELFCSSHCEEALSPGWTCGGCEELIPMSCDPFTVRIQGERVSICPSCYENTFYCEHCEESHWSDETPILYVEDVGLSVCEHCESDFFKCTECNCLYNNPRYLIETKQGDSLCESCATDACLTECQECGEVSTDGDGEFCDDCIEERRTDEENAETSA